MTEFRLVFGIAALAFCIYVFVVALQRRNVYFSILSVLASCYGIGKFIQFWHLGPLWLRGCLSDVGFIPAIVLAPVIAGQNKKAASWANLGLVLALVVETGQIIINPFIPKGHFGPRGDWVDVVIFISSYLVVHWLIAHLEDEAFSCLLAARWLIARLECELIRIKWWVPVRAKPKKIRRTKKRRG